MLKSIKIPSELYDRLAKHASGFETPANVIEKLLNAFEGDEQETSSGDIALAQLVPSRNYQKYVFEGLVFGKGRLVLAVVAKHVELHPGITFQQLQEVFPCRLQGTSNGVFQTLAKAQETLNREGRKRHYLNPDEVIKLSDCSVAVSSQWGTNTENFIQHAKELGYEIEVVKPTK